MEIILTKRSNEKLGEFKNRVSEISKQVLWTSIYTDLRIEKSIIRYNDINKTYYDSVTFKRLS